MRDDSNTSGCIRQTITSLIVITMGMLLCCVASVAGIDVLCHNNIEETLPLYPGATVVSEQSGFFRPRAMGISMTILTTSDSAAIVRRWYLDHHLAVINDSMDSSGRSIASSKLATVDSDVEEDADTGLTRITLTSECAYN